MAFRIHDSVVRGEVDNRVKGLVRGKIWMEGRAEPLILKLKGNAWPDLAGSRLTFINPKKRFVDPHTDSLNALQQGTIGDLTASRKVRVFDIPLEEALTMIRHKEKPPEHMANCLYLEWFSDFNGRVVIESTDYELTISAPEWRMTPEEDDARAQTAAQGMTDFMNRLTDAIEKHHEGQKDPEEEWDEHDYEKFLKECDARTDKYGELLDKYGDSDEADAKIAKEMGWEQQERSEDDNSPSVEEINAFCGEAADEPLPEPPPEREGIDWIRCENGEFHHPLQRRCFESAVKFWKQADEMGLEKLANADLDKFISEFQTTGAKLAGALGPIARGFALPEPAFTVAYLKRALDHLHKSQAGLEAIAPKNLLPETMVIEARKELFEIREGILKLMDELRGRS